MLILSPIVSRIFVHFGICRIKICSFPFSLALLYPLNSQGLTDIVISFSFVNFLWRIGVTCLRGLQQGDYVSVWFFPIIHSLFLQLHRHLDPLGLSNFSPQSSTCHLHHGLINCRKHSLALCLVRYCQIPLFQRICCTKALQSMPTLWFHWWLQLKMQCIRGKDSYRNIRKRIVFFSLL